MLIVSENSSIPVSMAIAGAPIAMGRAANNQVVIDDPSVEDLHCLIDRGEDGELRLTDLSAGNGVLLNGHRIDIEARLKPGDVLQIGSHSYKITANAEPENPGGKKMRRAVLPSAQRRPLFFSSAAQRSKSAAYGEHQLEVVTYWGNTVLSVDHFHPTAKGLNDVTIGPPDSAPVLSGDQSLSATWVLAEALEDSYILRLKDGMRAKVRAKNDAHALRKLHDQSELLLSKEDVARVRHGMVDYLIRFVQLPVVQLPDLRARDKFLTWSALTSAAMYIILIALASTVKPMRDTALVEAVPEAEPWMTVEMAPPEVKPHKPEPHVQKQKTIERVVKQRAVTPAVKSPVTTRQPTHIPPATTAMAVIPPEKALAPRSDGAGPLNPGTSAPVKGRSQINAPGADAAQRPQGALTDLRGLSGNLGKVLAKDGPGGVSVQFRDGPGSAGLKQGTSGRDYNLGGIGNNSALTIAGGGNRTGEWGEHGRGPAGEGSLTRSLSMPGGRKDQIAVNVAKPQDPVSQISISMEDVYAVIRQNLNQVRHCYEQKLQRSPNAAGTIKVRFSIVNGGRVASPEVVQDNIGDAAMNGCILGKISRWAFPNPRAGSVNVSYPFNFTPQL